MNPWGLTERQEAAIAQIVVSGHSKIAADEMGISHRTLECHLKVVKAKMEMRHLVLCAVAYDRWKRGGA